MGIIAMTPTDAAHIAFENIEGWVGDRVHQIVEFIRRDHDAHDVQGDIAEIGVHHGKLFYIIAAAARADDRLLAIDLFGQQGLNVDSSGSGDRVIFERHADNLFPDLKPQIRILESDSMSLRASDLRPLMAHDRIRIFSVDGGHNPEHVVNDLNIAQETIAPRGVVMLDDFFGYMWPSVTEGFFRYMSTMNRRLAPFLIFQNKLFLTTYSEHESVLEHLRAYLDEVVGNEIHTNWGYGKICGFSVIAHAR
jgi:hypothetical protein